MVTGIETAGLLLAILPLIVNQTDNYVQGLERLKTFRTRRYRREMESYYNSLSTQRSILENVLEKCLQGVVEYEEDVSELINDPLGSMWEDPSLQMKLRKKLGRDYDSFTRTLTEMSELVQEFSRKLGTPITDPTKTPNAIWKDSSVAEREIKKLKDVLSQSIYVDYINKIKGANAELQRLVDQSIYLEKSRRKQRLPKRQLLRFKNARKLAHSLYDILVRGKCWNCKCRDDHRVQIQIDVLSGVETSEPAELPKFRMVFVSKTALTTPQSWYLQEVETEPIIIDDKPAPVVQPITTTTMGGNVSFGRETKVKFAMVTSTVQSVSPWSDKDGIPAQLHIQDMCSTLSDVRANDRMCRERELLGFIADQSHRHLFYVLENSVSAIDPKQQSLEELLLSSSTTSSSFSNAVKIRSQTRTVFNRRDRLRLAAGLACSVLQFHGSWLKDRWRSKDILLTTTSSRDRKSLGHSYLFEQLSHNEEHHSGRTSVQQKGVEAVPTHLIRNEILFPLGLALVELSLCQTISSLRTADDDDRVEAVANLKTAARHLPDVRNESGLRYEEVVDKCLFWPGRKNTQFDDEEFQKEVFESIVTPLLDDLKDFEGRSKIY